MAIDMTNTTVYGGKVIWAITLEKPMAGVCFRKVLCAPISSVSGEPFGGHSENCP